MGCQPNDRRFELQRQIRTCVLHGGAVREIELRACVFLKKILPGNIRLADADPGFFQ
jgi:hypothetical protein